MRPSLLLAVLLLLGQQSLPAHAVAAGSRLRFQQITLESRPKGRGSAYKTLFNTGRVRGAHLSGGPELPMVSESTERLASADLRKVNRLVRALVGKPLPRMEQPDQKTVGFIRITIVLDDGKTLESITPMEEPLAPPELAEIVRILSRSRAGSW